MQNIAAPAPSGNHRRGGAAGAPEPELANWLAEVAVAAVVGWGGVGGEQREGQEKIGAQKEKEGEE